MDNGDKAAMPWSVALSSGGDLAASCDYEGGEGLTKREHFAAMAMQGLLSGNEITLMALVDISPSGDVFEGVAMASVEIADHLLKALENNNAS